MFAIIWLNYRLWIVPMNRIRSLEDVGYAHLKMGSAKRKKERINQVSQSILLIITSLNKKQKIYTFNKYFLVR